MDLSYLKDADYFLAQVERIADLAISQLLAWARRGYVLADEDRRRINRTTAEIVIRLECCQHLLSEANFRAERVRRYCDWLGVSDPPRPELLVGSRVVLIDPSDTSGICEFDDSLAAMNRWLSNLGNSQGDTQDLALEAIDLLRYYQKRSRELRTALQDAMRELPPESSERAVEHEQKPRRKGGRPPRTLLRLHYREIDASRAWLGSWEKAVDAFNQQHGTRYTVEAAQKYLTRHRQSDREGDQAA